MNKVFLAFAFLLVIASVKGQILPQNINVYYNNIRSSNHRVNNLRFENTDPLSIAKSHDTKIQIEIWLDICAYFGRSINDQTVSIQSEIYLSNDSQLSVNDIKVGGRTTSVFLEHLCNGNPWAQRNAQLKYESFSLTISKDLVASFAEGTAYLILTNPQDTSAPLSYTRVYIIEDAYVDLELEVTKFPNGWGPRQYEFTVRSVGTLSVPHYDYFIVVYSIDGSYRNVAVKKFDEYNYSISKSAEMPRDFSPSGFYKVRIYVNSRFNDFIADYSLNFKFLDAIAEDYETTYYIM